MRKRLAAILVALLLAAATAGAGTAPAPLAETIALIRTANPAPARARAAQHLYELTQHIDPAQVDDKTVADMVALLDTGDDGVRLWVAAALGNLGHRARLAIPPLLTTLGKVECHGPSQPSAEAIRFALTRIGRKPPPPPCAPVKKDTSRSTPKAPPMPPR